MAHFTIRRLGTGDAEALFQLRREALRDSPLAFLASPEDDLAASAQAVAQLLERAGSAVLGAFSEGLCGMLGLHRGQHLKAVHKVNLWGLFVRSSCRAQGAGQQLLAAALAHARTLGVAPGFDHHMFSGRQAQLLAGLQHDVAALFELSRTGWQIAGQPDAAADHGQLAAGRAEPHGHAAV